jgi:hypothetical protein
LASYAEVIRHTKDFDMFVREDDAAGMLRMFAAAGFRTEMTFPHWLGKAYDGDRFVDVIFGAGNGIATVDDIWFKHAVEAQILGVPVKLIPPEEMIWSKGFLMERERYDGADIIHLLRARAHGLNWRRLLDRFGPHWRVLFSHLILFGFVYPGHRDYIPGWVMEEMMTNLRREMDKPARWPKLCYGTLISREQYLVDIEEWGYRDARLLPSINITEDEIADWTGAIDESGDPPTQPDSQASEGGDVSP